MVKVKMKVQTTYNEQILREGKEYDVPETTANRWHVSKIAEIVKANQPEEEN